jgi:uncharacterized protein YndB with AHSA1/START domain
MTHKDLTLSVTRLIDAPRDVVYRTWVEHLSEWWAPKPYTTPVVDIDLRPGGTFLTAMQDGEGNAVSETAEPGVVLEAIPNESVVFTDAFRPGWVPSDRAFMVGRFTFADEGGKTRYTASAQHWRPEDMSDHEKMGFHEGWGMVADQFEQVVMRLKG